jgi:hypothetical protein
VDEASSLPVPICRGSGGIDLEALDRKRLEFTRTEAGLIRLRRSLE